MCLWARCSLPRLHPHFTSQGHLRRSLQFTDPYVITLLEPTAVQRHVTKGNHCGMCVQNMQAMQHSFKGNNTQCHSSASFPFLIPISHTQALFPSFHSQTLLHKHVKIHIKLESFGSLVVCLHDSQIKIHQYFLQYYRYGSHIPNCQYSRKGNWFSPPILLAIWYIIVRSLLVPVVPTVERCLRQRPSLTHHLLRGVCGGVVSKRCDHYWTGYDNVTLSHGVGVEQDAIGAQRKVLT